ncbi:MAG: HAMP domain-containing protein, partial [Chloroflexota bacterium]
VALLHSVADSAAEYLVANDPQGLLVHLIDRREHYSSETHNTTVDYMVIYSDNGARLAGSGVPPQLAPLMAQPTGTSLLVDDGATLDFWSPVPEADAVLRLGLSTASIRQTVDTVTLQLLAITAIMMAIGLAAATFLTWVLTRPIKDLVQATRAVARGDFTRRVPRWADDEIGALATAFNQMTDALQQAEAERSLREHLREQYINGVIAAQENERKRIARELHDSTSQSLTSLLVGLQNLKHEHDAEKFDCHIDDLRTVIGATLDEVRALAWQLRPSVLDDLGLVSALDHTLQEFQRRYGLSVDFVASGLNGRLPMEIETTVYRVVQEGLTNIARYAQARSVSVTITLRRGRLRVIVEDDGVGFDVDAVRGRSESLGLQGIQERASLLGGSLAIESAPGKGTSLFIEIPVFWEYIESE